MPANLTPQYLAADKRFKEATTTEERIAALEEMLAVIPKHKGTDHMQGDLKAKLARLKAQAETQAKSGKRAFNVAIKPEGAGQVLIIGAPNTGKSQLIASLTNALPEIADYPFTTHFPQPGMMKFENVKIQLVDTPPISPGATEPWMYGLVQSADSVVLLVDCSADDCLEQVENVCADLKTRKIELREAAPSSRAEDGSYLVSTAVVGNKMDRPGAEGNLAALAEIYKDRFNPIGICATKPEGLDEFRRLAFKSLGKVRVHCKIPGKPADLNDPFTLRIGSTVTDFAQTIHKDVARSLQFARVWDSGKHNGVRVPKDFVLSDGDIVEVHAAE